MSDEVVDPTRPPRPGEEIDAEALAGYLGPALGLRPPLTIEQFPSGHSNLTYLVRAAPGDDGVARELVLRRPPVGSQVKSAHDMGREYRILSRLADVFPAAPRALHACNDPQVIGAPFYVMERIRGVILRRRPPLGCPFDPDQARRLGEALIDTLSSLHAVDWAAAGLGDLGRPEGYVGRQVSGWTKRWHDARLDDVPALEQVADWLAARIPPPHPPSLIHNDFKYDNLVLDPAAPERVIGVLDWELATIGDPLMDLGTALAYWVEAGDDPALQALAFGPTAAPGSPTRHQLAERYGEALHRRTGATLPDLTFYYCFALFKNAVIGQQIYYRYRKGLTRDARFAGFGAMVAVLGEVALRATDRGL